MTWLGKGKGSLQPGESFKDRPPESTHPHRGPDRCSENSPLCICSSWEHPGLSSRPPCLFPPSKEKRPTHLSLGQLQCVSWGEGWKHWITWNDRSGVWCRDTGYHRWFQGGKTGSVYWDYKCTPPSTPPLRFYRYTPHEYKMIPGQGCSLQHCL